MSVEEPVIKEEQSISTNSRLTATKKNDPHHVPKRADYLHTSLNLAEKMFTYRIKGFGDSMGHPMVIPVRFSKTKITDSDFDYLERYMNSMIENNGNAAEIAEYQKVLKQRGYVPVVDADGKPEKMLARKARELEHKAFINGNLCIGGYYYYVKNISLRQTPDLAQAAVDAIISYFIRDCLQKCKETDAKCLTIDIASAVINGYSNDVLMKGCFKQFLEMWLDDKPNKLCSKTMEPMRIDFAPPSEPKNPFSALDIEYFRIFQEHAREKRKMQGILMHPGKGKSINAETKKPTPKEQLELIKTSNKLVDNIIKNFDLKKHGVTIGSSFRRFCNDMNNYLMRIFIELCIIDMCAAGVVTLRNESFYHVLDSFFATQSPNYMTDLYQYVRKAVDKMMNYHKIKKK